MRIVVVHLTEHYVDSLGSDALYDTTTRRLVFKEVAMFRQRGTRRSLGMLVTCLLLGSVSCSEGPTSSLEDRVNAVFGDVIPSHPIDVPTVQISLPPTPRAWDTDDAALAEAVRAADGMVVIMFKDPASPRTLETGVRIGLSAATITGATDVVRSMGAEIIFEYRGLGAVLARINPSDAVRVRGNPLVDFVEPDLGEEVTLAIGRKKQGLAPVRMQSVPSAVGQKSAGGEVMTAAITNQADTLNWGLDSINVYPDGAWDVTLGNPGTYMLISTGHLLGHGDLPNVPVNNCGGFFGGCDDGPVAFSGTHFLGAALGPLNAYGWVGVAPEVPAGNTFVWGACDVNQDGSATCFPSQTAAGLDAARFAGVKVVHIATHASVFNATVATAVANARQLADIVMVAPAGNRTSTDPAGVIQYPAGLEDVLGVSGVDFDLTFADADPGGVYCSDFGSQWGTHVGIAAPFWGTHSWGPELTAFSARCGTQVSSAYVSGVAALVRAARPSDNAASVIGSMTQTARNLGSASFFGSGLVDAFKAVTTPYVPNPPPPLTVSISNALPEVPPNEFCTWFADASGGTGSYVFSWFRNGVFKGSGPEISLLTEQLGAMREIKVEVNDGQSTAIDKFTYTVTEYGMCFQ